MGTAFSAPAAGRFSTPVRGLRVLDSSRKIIIPDLVNLCAHTYPPQFSLWYSARQANSDPW